jgi:hypothetical protein
MSAGEIGLIGLVLLRIGYSGGLILTEWGTFGFYESR